MILGVFPEFDTTFAVVWFWFTVLVGLLWLKRHIEINRGAREPILSDADAQTSADALPTLTMLVAGKEEEACIGRCLSQLLEQDYSKLQIIAVNDRSDDRTGEIMDDFARRSDKVRAFHIASLPDGWFGKNHAMHVGVKQANSDWLCFTDADCEFLSPKLLSAAVSFAQREGVDFLSVLPKLEADTFWEKVIQPVAGAIMVYWNPPQKVNSPKSKASYANGAFILMTREAYDKIGGHEAVAGWITEDLKMAKNAKLAGVPSRVIRGGDMYQVRMYDGLRSIWHGWTRIFYGTFGSIGKLVASILLLCVASISPYVTLLLSPLFGVNWPLMAAAAGFTIVAQQSVLWRYYPLSGEKSPWAVTYPLGAVFCLGFISAGISRALGVTKTVWRGTAYKGAG